MKILVTGSAGHLGEALMRALPALGHELVGLDRLPSPFTHAVGSITQRALLRELLQGVQGVLHTATLHKPHVATHTRQDFVDTNLSGTLALLEESAAAGVGAFVFTSTTSAFGRALVPPPGAPAAWITEDVVPVVKNIYGATKLAAEDLCALVQREAGLPVLVLRTSRFFPEDDDDESVAAAYSQPNVQVNELLARRVDIQDVVDAHLLALQRAPQLGFGRYIVSATTPFTPEDLPQLRADAPAVLARRVPGYEQVYAQHGWAMFAHVDRVYVNTAARQALGWQPRWDFAHALACVREGRSHRSPLAQAVGAKGYHRAG
jgi:UDP-glucose 4-epimerase